jgi:uncharacterized protein DUF6498
MADKLDPQSKQELKELLGELGPDTALLFISNLTVIVLALVQGWSILPLLWIYWWQNVIIGFFNWRRMKQLKNFSAEGFKVDGKRVEATKKTKMDAALFFLLHYGVFQLFYLLFIMSLAKTIEYDVLLSATVGIVLFFFNHLYSYRYNLKKDLASKPNIGTMMFFPYLRVIPMHLIIFVGLWAGRGSQIELFFFLLLKTGVDLLMHIIQHVNWGEPYNPLAKEKKRMTLKQRMKLWFLLGWVAFVVLVVIALFVVAEINRASP